MFFRKILLLLQIEFTAFLNQHERTLNQTDLKFRQQQKQHRQTDNNKGQQQQQQQQRHSEMYHSEYSKEVWGLDKT